jgi:hypothetical protein
MHVYEQSTGKWFGPDGTVWGIGWSGQLGGRNNPIDQSIQDLGPCPEGLYTIGPSYTHPKLGQITMDLTPDAEDNEFGRSLFRIHGFGSDVAHASEGCIIQIRPVRVQIDASSDKRLQVVAEIPLPSPSP